MAEPRQNCKGRAPLGEPNGTLGRRCGTMNVQVSGYQQSGGAAVQQQAAPTLYEGIAEQLQTLGWIDKTAIGVLVVFFVLGLFKGFIWQVSRVGILLVAYFVSGRFGHQVAGLLDGGSSAPPVVGPNGAAQVVSTAPAETTIYIAYCVLFVVVLIALSLLTLLIKKLADKAGLGFFDRLGGGVLGVATGSCVVLFGIFVVHMFFPQSELARAAQGSHAMRISRRAIELLGPAVNDELRMVLALAPLGDGGVGQPGLSVGGPPPTPGGEGSEADRGPGGARAVPASADRGATGIPQPAGGGGRDR